MFQSIDSIGILKENEGISSLKLTLDSSDVPAIAWAEDTGSGFILKGLVKSGSQWVFTAAGSEISPFEGEYHLFSQSDEIHFVYVVKTGGPSGDLAVEYVVYDRSTAVLSDPVQVATGTIGSCFLFEYSSTVYIAYEDGTTVNVVDTSGTQAFATGLSTVSFTSGSMVRFAASNSYLLVGAAYVSSGTATPTFWMVNLATNTLVGTPNMNTVSDIDDFDFSIAYNSFGDGVAPAAEYRPFHVLLTYRNGSAFSTLIGSFEQDSTLTVLQYYTKTVAGYDDVHSESIAADFTVEDLSGFATVKLGNLNFFNSTNILSGVSTRGFDSNSNVGRNGASAFGGRLSNGNLHFSYAWDGNISYGYEPFGDAGPSIERDFVVAESSVWVDGLRRTELNRRLFHIPIYDENEKVAALCWVSQDLSCRLKMYDVDTRDFIYDFSGGKLGNPVHGVYDRRNARILVCDIFRIHGDVIHRGGSLVTFDVTDGTVTRYDSFGEHILFEPRAVALTADLVVVADTGNHRIVFLNRDDLSLNRVVSLDGMRFPHGLGAGISGELLVKCFDDDLMTPQLLHVDSKDNVVQKLPSAHKMGWDDVSGDLLPGSVFILESGREAEAGIHVVNRDGTTIMQKRLTVQTPIDYSVGSLFGDMMVIYADDVIGGFAPGGTENGFATVVGASDGFLVPRHLDRSFLLVVPGDVTSSFFEIRNDVDSASLKAESCAVVEFVPTAVYCLYNSGNAVVTDGTTTSRYDSNFDDTVWEKEYSFTISQIEENEYEGILIYLTESDTLVIADALTGAVSATFSMSADYFRYCHRKGWLYGVSGEVVTRYHLKSTSSQSGLSFTLLNKYSATVSDLVDIAVQEGTDKLWVATEHKLHKYNLSMIEETDAELWDSIERILPLNYPTAVYKNLEFDCPYSVKYSASTEKFVSVSEETGHMVTVGEGTHWFTIFDSDYLIQGVDIDGMTGDIYITDSSTDPAQIIRVNKYGDTETASEEAPAAGDVMIHDNDAEDLRGNFVVLSPPDYSTGSVAANFNIVSGTGTPLPWIASDTTENPELTFGWVEPDNSRHRKQVPVDVWHLNYTGMQGTKISVDKNLSFNEYVKGDLRRVPVFSWDFDADDPSDTLLTTSGTSFLRFSVVYGSLSPLGGADLESNISSCLLFDDKIALVSLGILYIYEFLSLEFIASVFMVDDVEVYTSRNGYLWCGSVSRGQIYRVQADDLSRFSTFEAGDAPIGMKWMEAEEKFVLVSQNSIQYMDDDGNTTAVYNCEEHTIVGFDINGDYIAMAFQHYDAIPFSDEFEEVSDFTTELFSRGRDKVIVFDRSNFKFAYDRAYDADVRAESVMFGNDDIIHLVSRRIVSSGSQYLVVDEVSLLTGVVVSVEISSTSSLVRSVFMPESDMLVNIMLDGTSIEFMSDDNSITAVKRFEARVGSACGYTAMPESIARTLNRTYTDGSSSSSSGSSGSTLANIGSYDAVQIIVGDMPGGSNRWNSGIVGTNKKSLLYGGGNNLEPGQRYYVSVRVRRGLVWGTYSTSEFVMDHFNNFPLPSSSSSSSLSMCRTLSAGGVVDIGRVQEQCVYLNFSGAQTGYIVINGAYCAVGWGSPVPVWDFGSAQAYTFSTIGESIKRSAAGYFYDLTWTSQSVLTFTQSGSSSSSSSSWSSSSFSSSSESSSNSSSSGSLSLSSSSSG